MSRRGLVDPHCGEATYRLGMRRTASARIAAESAQDIVRTRKY